MGKSVNGFTWMISPASLLFPVGRISEIMWSIATSVSSWILVMLLEPGGRGSMLETTL